MANVVDVMTDVAESTATPGVPFSPSYVPAAGVDRIVLMLISVFDPNGGVDLQDNVTVTLDSVDAEPKWYTAAGDRGFIICGFAVADDVVTALPIEVTMGELAASDSISYRCQFLTIEDAFSADASLNNAYVEVGAADDPIAFDIASPAATALLFGAGMWDYSATTDLPTFTPAAMGNNATEAVLVSGVGEGARNVGTRLGHATGLSGTQSFGFGGALGDTQPQWAVGFAIRSSIATPPPPRGASATNFNCECECGPANKTLAAYRRDLLIRCGFAAIADSPPPGTTELMNAFLSDAQSFLHKKYPALHTKRFFRWTMTEGQRFYGILENDDSTMPRIPVTFAAGVGNAVQVTWNGYAAPPTNRGIFFTAAEGETLPYGMLPNTVYFVVNGSAGVSNMALTPGGTPITITLGSDTEGVSHGYAEVRQAIFNLEPYADIEGAWLVDLNGSWLPMTCGIPPTFYTTVSQPGLPVRYEIRSCIEVFPAPAAAYSLYIKGHFGLRPFELDSDKPTIDGHLVYLWALANALDYYGKPSAAGIATQAQDYLGQLVAGTHTGKRYVPGMRPLPPAIIPIFAPWPGGDP